MQRKNNNKMVKDRNDYYESGYYGEDSRDDESHSRRYHHTAKYHPNTSRPNQSTFNSNEYREAKGCDDDTDEYTPPSDVEQEVSDGEDPYNSYSYVATETNGHTNKNDVDNVYNISSDEDQDNDESNNHHNDVDESIEESDKQSELINDSCIQCDVPLEDEDKVNLDDFEMLRILGTGAYGLVYLVRKVTGYDEGTLYAMKMLVKKNIIGKKKLIEHTRTERQILEYIRLYKLPYLVQLHYAFQTENKLYLVLDYIQGGELFSHIFRVQNFSEDYVRIYIAETVLAIEKLHSLNILYRDIKLENIMLDAQGHIRITDFGLSKILPRNKRTSSFCGTIEYMAPEVLKPNKGYDLCIDWWSVGVLIYELLTGISPFVDPDDLNNLHEDIYERMKKPLRNLPENVGDDVKDLIQKMLMFDKKKRLGCGKRGAAEIKAHPFFDGIDWQKLADGEIEPPFKPEIKYELDTRNFSKEFTEKKLEDDKPDDTEKIPNLERFFQGFSFIAPTILANNKQWRSLMLSKKGLDIEVVLSTIPRNSPFLQEYSLVKKTVKNSILGYGTGSICLKCYNKDKEPFAVKIVPVDVDIDNEIELLYDLQGHPNIVKYYQLLKDSHYKYIIMEYLPGGNLLYHFYERTINGWDMIAIFAQIVKAVAHMHANNIAHRDLKPENILFENTRSKVVKIIDFGVSERFSGDSMTSVAGTLQYMAPEILQNGARHYSEACDMWSLGAILYTMMCGESPFKMPCSNILDSGDESDELEQLINHIKQGKFNETSAGWLGLNTTAKDLIRGLLSLDPETRITMKRLLKHPWVVSFDSLMLQKLSSRQPQKIMMLSSTKELSALHSAVDLVNPRLTENTNSVSSGVDTSFETDKEFTLENKFIITEMITGVQTEVELPTETENIGKPEKLIKRKTLKSNRPKRQPKKAIVRPIIKGENLDHTINYKIIEMKIVNPPSPIAADFLGFDDIDLIEDCRNSVQNITDFNVAKLKRIRFLKRHHRIFYNLNSKQFEIRAPRASNRVRKRLGVTDVVDDLVSIPYYEKRTRRI